MFRSSWKVSNLTVCSYPYPFRKTTVFQESWMAVQRILSLINSSNLIRLFLVSKQPEQSWKSNTPQQSNKSKLKIHHMKVDWYSSCAVPFKRTRWMIRKYPATTSNWRTWTWDDSVPISGFGSLVTLTVKNPCFATPFFGRVEVKMFEDVWSKKNRWIETMWRKNMVNNSLVHQSICDKSEFAKKRWYKPSCFCNLSDFGWLLLLHSCTRLVEVGQRHQTLMMDSGWGGLVSCLGLAFRGWIGWVGLGWLDLDFSLGWASWVLLMGVSST